MRVVVAMAIAITVEILAEFVLKIPRRFEDFIENGSQIHGTKTSCSFHRTLLNPPIKQTDILPA